MILLCAVVLAHTAVPRESRGSGGEGGADRVHTRRAPLACDLNGKVDPRGVPWTRGGWQSYGVVRLNGSAGSETIPAQLNFLGGQWEYNNSQMPYVVWMPERRRLMLAASVDKPSIKAVVVFSEDLGATWTRPRWLHTDAAGKPDVGAATELTYLGEGKLVLGTETRYWISTDYGETWRDHAPVPVGSDGKALYQWDPMLVDRDPRSGKILRLVETRYKENGTFDTAGYFSQGCIRSSRDEGKTWSPETSVPQWKGVNEIVLCRAANGDLIAACRTDNARQFLGRDDDQYSGLATSVSSDDGRNWSEVNHLYEWGRHHPSLVAMPDGEIVLCYVVRKGYVAGKDGLARFGIEAVVSRDQGRSWDLDHKYLLASNSSVMKGTRENWGSPQSTSSVLLPNGEVLTAFGTGVRNVPEQTLWEMDVALVRWRPSRAPVNEESTLRRAAWPSDQRNKFDLDLVK